MKSDSGFNLAMASQPFSYKRGDSSFRKKIQLPGIFDIFVFLLFPTCLVIRFRGRKEEKVKDKHESCSTDLRWVVGGNMVQTFPFLHLTAATIISFLWRCF